MAQEMIFGAKDSTDEVLIVIVSDTFEYDMETDSFIFFTGDTYNSDTGEPMEPIFYTGESYPSHQLFKYGKAAK